MAQPNNMHNLTTLIKRLEAATSRLEDIATAVDGATATTNGTSDGVARSTSEENIHAGSVASVATVQPIEKKQEPLPREIEEFDEFIQEVVTPYVTASQKIGELVEKQAEAVKNAFEAERTYLLVATKAKKPDTQPPELMEELHKHMSTVDEIRESNRASPLFVHLSAVSEGIVALGWIVEKRPKDYINDTLGAAQYYGNKILKEYKDKDTNHTDFIQAYYKIWRSLATFVTDRYQNGVVWNTDGIDVLDALKQIQSGGETPRVTPAGGAPPPPPPPLPSFDKEGGAPAPPPLPASSSVGGGADMGAIFDQLNQGSGVTSKLRKVDKSEMTHKNPSLRAQPQRTVSQSSGGRGKSPTPNKKPESLKSKKPGRKELDGSKWIVENFENTGNEIIEIPAELNHSILISRCTKCIIKVKGKANAISIDNCASLSILVESLVSSLDVIKSPKIQAQIDGIVPTVLLDQVDGGIIYLCPKTINTTEFFTSKCSSINIVLPPKDDSDDDSREVPIPEQIRSVIKNGNVVSEIVEHAG